MILVIWINIAFSFHIATDLHELTLITATTRIPKMVHVDNELVAFDYLEGARILNTNNLTFERSANNLCWSFSFEWFTVTTG